MRMHPQIKRRAARSLLVLCLIFGIGTALATLGFAWQLAVLITGAFLEGRNWVELQANFYWLILAVLLRLVFPWLQSLAGARMAEKVKSNLRSELTKKMANNPTRAQYASGDDTGVGGNAWAWVRGIDALDAWFALYYPQQYLAILVPLLLIAAVFPVDWISALVFAGTVPLIPVFMILVGIQADKKQKEQWRILLRLGNHFVETLQGLRTLRLLGQAKRRARQIRHAAQSYRLATMRVLRVGFVSSMALELVATISTAIIAVEIGLRLLYGHLDLQQSLFVLLLAPEIYAPLRQLGARYHAAMEGAEAARDLVKRFGLDENQEFLTKPKKINSLPTEHKSALAPECAKDKGADPRRHGIMVKNLCITWPGASRPALQDVSLEFPPGSTTVLAGPSGAGKSTLAAALLGLVPIQQGTIVCGELEINSLQKLALAQQQWHSQLAWVPQRPTLFHGSLEENISMGNSRASKREIHEAAQRAGIHEWISSLPQAYQTQVQENGSRLSGGQRQRLALARAFVRKASLLILDEPTSQLDVENATWLAQSFADLGEGRTVIHIAHRRSTLQSAERVAFLREGQLEGLGSHLELLRNCKNYATMMGNYE